MNEIISKYETKTHNNRGVLMKSGVPAGRLSKPRRKKPKKIKFPGRTERPGWIPPEVTHNWDTDPYAYQTEEELMPAGSLHGGLLTYIAEILRDFFQRKGLKFLADTFILYRDSRGKKRRISPDLMIIPYDHEDSSAYDMDSELPPLAAAEITSPNSRKKDMEKKAFLYSDLGIPVYLVIDQIAAGGKPHKKIGLHLWRRSGNSMIRIEPDDRGYLDLPEMKFRVRSEERNLIFTDIETGEILLDNSQHRQKAEQEKQRADQEKQRADQENQRANQEKKRADQERQRAERLEAKLKSLGISPD